MKLFAILGAIFATISVGAGAFGAHALEESLSEHMLEIWETAARYQMYHALGLFAAAWLSQKTGAAAATVGGWGFIVGILIFSGSLYTLALTDIRWLGAITPIGGLAMIIGWVALCVAAFSL